MFSYVFMKILEGRPDSYDRRMRKATRGRIEVIKKQVAQAVPEGSHVLEIGCGTGDLAKRLIARNCTVEGFDLNPEMIKAAQNKIDSEGLKDRLSVINMGVDGMDALADGAYDVVVSTLVFSELSDDERHYALTQSHRVLRPGGIIVIADEVIPRTAGKRALHTLTRAPAAAVTFLISRNSTSPIADLAGDLDRAGFELIKEERSHGDAFSMVICTRGNEKETP